MRRILLTNSSLVALVNDKGFLKACRRKGWYLHPNGHVRSTDRPCIFLHHLVNGKPPKGLQTDHRNGNPLDNRRSNLRNASPTQNQMNRRKSVLNTSGFKGVSWFSRTEKWRTQIRVGGKQRFLGYFDSLIEAAEAYDVAAKELFGEFARTNFPMRFPRFL